MYLPLLPHWRLSWLADHVQVDIYNSAGILAFNQGDYEKSTGLYEEALEVMRSI